MISGNFPGCLFDHLARPSAAQVSLQHITQPISHRLPKLSWQPNDQSFHNGTNPNVPTFHAHNRRRNPYNPLRSEGDASLLAEVQHRTERPRRHHLSEHAGPPRDIRFLDWGLIFDDKDVQAKDDRVTTVPEVDLSAPRYTPAFRFKRCLILADGLYLWKSANDEPKYMLRRDRQPFTFAGIREHYASGDISFDTFAIITTSLNGDGSSGQAMPGP